jgi:hypothetical protein
MSFLGHQRRLPHDIGARFARYGRMELLGHDSGEDPMRVYASFAPIREYARAAPDAYAHEVLALAPPPSSWATYGAGRSTWGMLNLPRTPAVASLLDTSIGFLSAHGLPPKNVTGVEWSRWIESGGTNDSWLPIRTPPTPEQVVIPEIGVGQEVLLACTTSAADANRFLLRRIDEHLRLGRRCSAKRRKPDPYPVGQRHILIRLRAAVQDRPVVPGTTGRLPPSRAGAVLPAAAALP